MTCLRSPRPGSRARDECRMAGESILVVDDSAANLKLARVLLQHEGYEVRTAVDAEDALRVLSTVKPRLILMAVQLPGMDGLELTRRLRADVATKDIVVLALSASSTSGDEQRALAAGCDGCVAKPIDIGSLRKVIAGCLVARPVSSQGAAGEAASASPILVVEDNAVTRKMIRVTLKAEGYSVLEAADGQTALRLVAEHEPAMVLLDCKLPDMDGFEIARRLRALDPNLPIVAVTGWAHADEARVLTAGFLDVLLKPVGPSRLIEIVERYARHPTPRTSSNGRVVRLAAERKPDIIVSDVLMPRMDGFSVCKAIRADAVLARIPIVLMSAHYLEAEDRKLAAGFGANRYVSRTAGFGPVVRAVVEALDSPAGGAEVPHGDELQADYLRRITHQLERQASLGAGLARQVALQTTALSVLDHLTDSLSRELNPESALNDTLAQC